MHKKYLVSFSGDDDQTKLPEWKNAEFENSQI